MGSVVKNQSKLEETTTKNTNKANSETVQLHYESNRYQEREACRECGSSNVYTRVYFHARTLHSRWLCFNCSEDYVKKRGYQLLTVQAVIQKKEE